VCGVIIRRLAPYPVKKRRWVTRNDLQYVCNQLDMYIVGARVQELGSKALATLETRATSEIKTFKQDTVSRILDCFRKHALSKEPAKARIKVEDGAKAKDTVPPLQTRINLSEGSQRSQTESLKTGANVFQRCWKNLKCRADLLCCFTCNKNTR
jgi:hypothetical protein